MGRRTGRFFLDSFKTRLREQREQRKLKKMEFGGRDGSKVNTKEDKKAKRKKILSNIGQDLLVVANDQPFRFPALFTFVVRAFSVLDGIGKQLDPRFDISEISAPYARDLLLEQRPGFSKLQDKYQKGADRQWEATKSFAEGFHHADGDGLHRHGRRVSQHRHHPFRGAEHCTSLGQ